MEKLIGTIVQKVEVSDGEQELRLTTDAGVFVYATWADCCSETWFAEIIGFDALIGKVVVEVDNLELPEKDDGHTRQQYDRWYGVQITTSGGRCQIVFRNSSNGYYGGSVEAGHDDTSHKWRPIADDWTAYA